MSHRTDFIKAHPGVSHETLTHLDTYAKMLEEWQKKINLVGPKTISELWTRHFLDSAQLFAHLPKPDLRLADFGSGAGFPGLVLAILGVTDVHLVESDQRKSIFMREVARATSAPAKVHNKRIEELAPLEADIITARALAPLDKLLALTFPHLKAGGEALFLKGAGWQDEIEAANTAGWRFHTKHFSSKTDPNAVIVRLSEITPPSE